MSPDESEGMFMKAGGREMRNCLAKKKQQKRLTKKSKKGGFESKLGAGVIPLNRNKSPFILILLFHFCYSILDSRIVVNNPSFSI